MIQKKIDLQGLFVKLLQEYMGGKKNSYVLGLHNNFQEIELKTIYHWN